MIKSGWFHSVMMLLLGIGHTYAQDSLLQEKESALYRLERQALLQQNRFRGTATAALRSQRWQMSGTDIALRYKSDLQDKYDWQKGAGSKGGQFTAKSYLRDVFEHTTVWGEAHYTKQTVTQLNHNASLDYDRVFPYFLADSVGGDQQMEIYRFGGGLARNYDRWTIGAQAYVTANHAFRKRDPRPNNNSSVFSLEGGAAYRLDIPYTVGVSLEGELYKQTNTLSYKSERGRPMVVNWNGMGVYNSLLTGTGASDGTTVFFSAHSLGGSIHIIPQETGFWGKGRFGQERGGKESRLSFAEINNWTDDKLDIDLGYDGTWRDLQYAVAASWNMQRREGREGLFNNQSAEERLVKIAEKLSYRYFLDRYSAALTVGQQQWNAQIHGALTDRNEQYAAPYRMQKVRQGEIGIDMQYFWIAERQLWSFQLGVTNVFNVDTDDAFRSVNRESGIGQLLYNNLAYIRKEPFVVRGSVRWDMPAIKQWKPYISADGGYATAVDRKCIDLRIGLVF